jgi:hypothetical protein
VLSADNIKGGTMNKRETFIELELSGEKLDSLVSSLRERLLGEFWGHIPDGSQRDEIRARLERNILAALNHKMDEIEAT